jgi:hypothetical protein
MIEMTRTSHYVVKPLQVGTVAAGALLLAAPLALALDSASGAAALAPPRAQVVAAAAPAAQTATSGAPASQTVTTGAPAARTVTNGSQSGLFRGVTATIAAQHELPPSWPSRGLI